MDQRCSAARIEGEGSEARDAETGVYVQGEGVFVSEVRVYALCFVEGGRMGCTASGAKTEGWGVRSFEFEGVGEECGGR